MYIYIELFDLKKSFILLSNAYLSDKHEKNKLVL